MMQVLRFKPPTTERDTLLRSIRNYEGDSLIAGLEQATVEELRLIHRWLLGGRRCDQTLRNA